MAEKNTHSILESIRSKLNKFDKKENQENNDEPEMVSELDSEFEYLSVPEPAPEEENTDTSVEDSEESVVELEVDGKNHGELDEKPLTPIEEENHVEEIKVEDNLDLNSEVKSNDETKTTDSDEQEELRRKTREQLQVKPTEQNESEEDLEKSEIPETNIEENIAQNSQPEIAENNSQENMPENIALEDDLDLEDVTEDEELGLNSEDQNKIDELEAEEFLNNNDENKEEYLKESDEQESAPNKLDPNDLLSNDAMKLFDQEDDLDLEEVKTDSDFTQEEPDTEDDDLEELSELDEVEENDFAQDDEEEDEDDEDDSDSEINHEQELEASLPETNNLEDDDLSHDLDDDLDLDHSELEELEPDEKLEENIAKEEAPAPESSNKKQDYESELEALERELEEQEKISAEKFAAKPKVKESEVPENIEDELEKELMGFNASNKNSAPAIPDLESDKTDPEILPSSANESAQEFEDGLSAENSHQTAIVESMDNSQNSNRNILSEDTIKQATNSVKKLVDAKNVVAGISNFSQSPALKDLASDMLEPRLERWLNENLANLVEDVVREEIKKILPQEDKE